MPFKGRNIEVVDATQATSQHTLFVTQWCTERAFAVISALAVSQMSFLPSPGRCRKCNQHFSHWWHFYLTQSHVNEGDIFWWVNLWTANLPSSSSPHKYQSIYSYLVMRCCWLDRGLGNGEAVGSSSWTQSVLKIADAAGSLKGMGHDLLIGLTYATPKTDLRK